VEDEYPKVGLDLRVTLAGKSEPVKYPFEICGGAGKTPSQAVFLKEVDKMDRQTPYSFSRVLSLPYRETIARVKEALKSEGAECPMTGG
jgi:hypothetical protein